MSETAKSRVFLSHTHSDAQLAQAVDGLLKSVFGSGLSVRYSSSKELDAGVRSGEDWFRWIVNEIRDCQVALILLTPASIQKPWILWESGAVYGAAEALRGGDEKQVTKVRPLVFQLAPEEVPSPLQRLQTLDGTAPADVQKLLLELLAEEFKDVLNQRMALQASVSLPANIAEYTRKVSLALKNAPLTVTEAAVQEWLNRLNDIEQQRRTSEVGHLHDWLRIAFGRETESEERPIDLRIHRRLAEMYQAGKQFKNAAREYRLAERLAPRDLYLLRKLGQALLDDSDREGAKDVIDRIDELDPQASATNQECAALKGRWLTEGRQYDKAIAVYSAAEERNPHSYYLCELEAQACLLAKKREDAQAAYKRAVSIIEGLHEPNMWTTATLATASIVAGDEVEAIEHLERVQTFGPTANNLQSIEKGLRSVGQALNAGTDAVARWVDALHGRAPARTEHRTAHATIHATSMTSDAES